MTERLWLVVLKFSYLVSCGNSQLHPSVFAHFQAPMHIRIQLALQQVHFETPPLHMSAAPDSLQVFQQVDRILCAFTCRVVEVKHALHACEDLQRVGVDVGTSI